MHFQINQEIPLIPLNEIKNDHALNITTKSVITQLQSAEYQQVSHLRNVKSFKKTLQAKKTP